LIKSNRTSNANAYYQRKDFRGATAIYQLSAMMGHRGAQLMVGEAYYSGIGVSTKDHVIAAK